MPVTVISPEGGLRATTSGLLVPAELSRTREVWTRDEAKLMERVAKMLTARGLLFQLACYQPACKGHKLTRFRNADGGITLRCNCTDRVWVKAF